MEKTDVLVVGGGPAALIAAVTGKSHYPDKDFTLVRKHEKVMVPCGIPYIYGTLNEVDKNIMPDMPLEKAGVNVKIDEITEINREKKLCKTKSGSEIGYDKLIIATGSEANRPGWLEGAGLENVFVVDKSMKYLSKLKEKLNGKKKITVVGGGFIGVEVSDELNKAGFEVELVELLPHVLMLAFDPEIAEEAENVLKERGVKVNSGKGIEKILGDKKAEGVMIKGGEKIECDAVILAMGYKPNAELAEKSGLEINAKGFIKVDEYMRTTDSDVFAVGDCAEKRDFITREISMAMLASTATSEARVAGMNLYKLSTIKTFNGTISIFATALGDDAYGVAGITEAVASQKNIDYAVGVFEKADRHPGTLPGASKQKVKLVALKECGTIIGGEISGGLSTGELTNLIGFIIQNRMTVNSIVTAQIGTHPLLTAAPTAYPLIKAAEAVISKMHK